MADVAHGDRSGTWRRGEFVLWTDVFVPVLASLVWLALLILAIAAALPVLQHYGVPPLTISKLLPALMRQPVATQFLTATSDLVLLFFLWRIARRVADGSLVARYRSTPRVLLLAGLVGGVAMGVLTMIAISQLVAHSLVKFHSLPSERLFAPGPAFQYPVTILTVGLIAPFVEEYYFRGVLLSWLGAKITIVPAALVSAIVFALLHFRYVSHPGLEGWVLTGVIGLVGLINAILAVRTRSLWPPFAFHAAYNSTLLGTALAIPFLH